MFFLETDRLHPFEQVSNPVVLAVVPEAKEKSIGTKFDVIAHHTQVHPDQLNRDESANTNSISISTVLHMISVMHAVGSLLTIFE